MGRTGTDFKSGASVYGGIPLLGGVRGMIPTGSTFFVSSTTAGCNNSPEAGTKEVPFATLNYAVTQCTASVGDLIIVMPGHVESVTTAGGLAINKAGLTILGAGYGALRPKVNLASVVGASCTISAASVSINNILFTGGLDALTGPITISGADCSLTNFETRDVTGQATDFIVTTAAADRLFISGWTHRGATAAGANEALQIVGGDGAVVENFSIWGNFAVAAIQNVTTAATNLRIGGGTEQNFIQNGLDSATVVAVTLVSTTTGSVGPNINARIGVDSTSNSTNITEAFVGAAVQFFQPLNVCNLGGEVAMQTNITATTDA